MRNKGIELGTKLDLLEIDSALVFAAAGSETTVKFDKAPRSSRNKKILVHAIVVTLPAITAYAMPDNKYGDGVALSELIANSSLVLASDSPPAMHNNGHVLWQNVDGYRLLQALTFMSGRKPFYASGSQAPRLVLNAANQTSLKKVAAFKKQSLVGNLPNIGPFFEDTTGGSFADTLAVMFWVGARREHDLDDTGIPIEYFLGVNARQPGNMKLTLGSTMANIAVTWGTLTGKVHLLVSYVPTHKTPLPLVPKIVYQNSYSESVFVWPSQPILWAGAMSRLTAAGAMQTESITRAITKVGNEEIDNQIYADKLTALSESVCNAGEESLELSYTQESISDAVATRYSRCGSPVLAHVGSAMDAPGALDETVSTNFQSATLPLDMFCLCLTPNTPPVIEQAERLFGGMATPHTRNATQANAVHAPFLPWRVNSMTGDGPTINR